MIDPKNCKHLNYDISWSHGECPRCTDCGIVGEFKPFPNIVWNNDPLQMAVALQRCKNKEGFQHMVNFLMESKRSGFMTYDERLKNYQKK